ncbi:MAG TPA: hypothetical protein VN258_20210 [Mobilitalea sp.]|nr:hypothetical protein [Mobilitalea sp.]
MRCNVCGRLIQNEEANFCEYCGNSFREQKQSSNHIPAKEQGLPYGFNQISPGMPGQSDNRAAGAPFPVEQERQTSFMSWIATYGLLFIPIFGWIVFIVLLFIWAFSDATPKNKKNWARATLIFVAVAIVVFIVWAIITVLPVYQDMYQQMQNGTFDPNTFYSDYLKKYN